MDPLETKTSPFLNNHIWYQQFRFGQTLTQGPAGILFMFALFYGFYVYFRDKVVWFLGLVTQQGKCWGKCNIKRVQNCFKEKLKIDEEIDEYDEVLGPVDRKFTLAEELNLNMYGIYTMFEESYLELKDKYQVQAASTGKRTLTGVHTYDILKNPAYIEAFQYYSSDLPERDDFIIDDDEKDDNNSSQSDLVRILLNLAFIEGGQEHKFFNDLSP